LQQALIPLGAIALLACVVYRWAGDEFEREHRLSIGAANAVAALCFLHAMTVVLVAAGGVWSIEVPAVPAAILGAPLVIGGAVLVVASARALGTRERVLGITVDAVITDGPYGRERHPFYVGWSLALLGVAVAGRSGLAFGIAALLMLALILVGRLEERVLLGELGSDFESYRKDTVAIAGLRGVRR
jgi:protein-S-isoprenylcysteine O-methyltransferase Ste14